MNGIGYSAFDLSHSRKTAASFGQLFPILCEETVPGDIFRIGAQFLVESLPTVDLVNHRVYADVYYYYVPYRLLDENFDEFIRGGLHGTTIGTAVTPKWDTFDSYSNVTNKELHNYLWYQFGFPRISNVMSPLLKSHNNGQLLPVSYPRTAYNMIYFYYYTQHIFDVAGEQKFNSSNSLYANEHILLANWFNDYFTTALPYRQRGSLATVGLNPNPAGKSSYFYKFGSSFDEGTPLQSIPTDVIPGPGSGAIGTVSLTGFAPVTMQGMNLDRGLFKYEGVSHPIPPSSASSVLTLTPRENIPSGSFSIDDLRSAIIMQQYMELNTRNAEFYSDFIYKNFGVSTGDGRFQMPEYIGSVHTEVHFNEITSLSETDGKHLGEKIALGRAVTGDFVTKFRSPEYGLIIGLMCIRPQNEYYGGFSRNFLRHTCTDFYVPSFAHLPFQEVYSCELAVEDVHFSDVFGYQGRFDELRTHQNIVCAPYFKNYEQRTFVRQFTSTPRLGKEFLKCKVYNNNFVYPDYPQFTVELYHSIKATRPLPQYSQPMDFGL